jgi:hypothetical protein
MPGWNDISAILRHILDSIPFYPDQLAISGEKIAECLGRNSSVGKFQRTLLARIQSGEMLNTPEEQSAALTKRVKRENQKNHVYNSNCY